MFPPCPPHIVLQGDIDDFDDEDEQEGSSMAGGPTLGSVVRVSLLSALPFALAAAVMLSNAYHAKRRNERHWHTALPLLASCLAFLLLPLLARGEDGAVLALLMLAAAASGIWATHGPLFSWPAAILSHQSSTIGFAMVKTAGAVGSFCGPLLVGLMATYEHGFGGAMLLLAGACACAAAAVLAFRALQGAAGGEGEAGQRGRRGGEL